MAGNGQLPPEATENVDGTVSPEEAKRALRRRLLKAGAIGAPLVVTLKSNTGWAASLTCMTNLQVPDNIDTKNFGKSDGGLVNYSGKMDQRKYIQALSNDKRLSGMPGYSCVASIMMSKG